LGPPNAGPLTTDRAAAYPKVMPVPVAPGRRSGLSVFDDRRAVRVLDGWVYYTFHLGNRARSGHRRLLQGKRW